MRTYSAAPALLEARKSIRIQRVVDDPYEVVKSRFRRAQRLAEEERQSPRLCREYERGRPLRRPLRSIYFGTLKIARRFPPMFMVSMSDPTKTFLLFLFMSLHGPFVIRSPRVAGSPA